MPDKKLEVWLRGPLPGIPALLQPVGHALLQAREEVEKLIIGFPENLLWEKPAGQASVGFHLQHLTGVLDRLFTYARAETLTPEQIEYLAAEGNPGNKERKITELVQKFNNQVDKALAQLMQTNINQITEVMYVGRNQVPSTLLGLLFHAAEHNMRHLGQLLVTVRFLQAGYKIF